MSDEQFPESDRLAVSAQLSRPARGVHAVAHRCPCGLPDVVMTKPRLEDGTPFPTTFYLTCPSVNAQISTLESSGLMRQMTQRIADEPELGAAYAAAHIDYVTQRAKLGRVPEIEQVSAGGMPTRVKCLHALVAHALGRGPGVNPLGDEVLAHLSAWWRSGPCVGLCGPGQSSRVDSEPVT
ncbi:MAG: DUF501 domain-containing protein [Mycobacteriales bacterium]